MVQKILILASCAIIISGMSMCNPTSSFGASSAKTVSTIKFVTGDITNWSVDNNKSSVYTPTAWRATALDGGVDQYTSTQGLTFTEVVDQTIIGPSSKTFRIYIIDYSTAANAKKMFTAQKELWINNLDRTPFYSSDTVSVKQYSRSPDLDACAHFKQFYIELSSLEYTDYTQAQTDAISILALFEGRINR